jgi:hypothetical protein
MEFLSNCAGPRVDSRKVQGLFSKRARPNWYALIRAVGSGSSGTNQRGGDRGSGGGDCSPETVSAAALRRCQAISGLRWLILLEPRSGMINVAQGNHLRLSLGLARLGLRVRR